MKVGDRENSQTQLHIDYIEGEAAQEAGGCERTEEVEVGAEGFKELWDLSRLQPIVASQMRPSYLSRKYREYN